MNISMGIVFISRVENSLRNYFEYQIREKGLEFEFKIDADVPQKIITDELRFNQILRNFMSNSVKFTDKGRISVHIFKPGPAEDLSKSGLDYAETIAVSVKDTGIGIPKEKQREIFEAFQQVDGSITRKYGGTGLGLSITRELVKMLGGEIKLESEPGKGSEFILFHPFNAEKTIKDPVKSKKMMIDFPGISINPPKEKTNPPNDSKSLSFPDHRTTISPKDNSILIIEDDINFAGLLAKICEEKGISYLTTAMGEEGIELAREFLPKGIILDIKLPGIDGWEVLERLKNSARTRHIPVHMISSYEETIEAYNKGVFGYLTKPVTKDKLESIHGNAIIQ